MISVIIPVYNDPEGLRDTLESLVDQDIDEQYEILPVDNKSTDNTGEVIKEFENNFPSLVKGLEENNTQSSYAARNKGAKNAEGNILCFLDADMWVEDSYLNQVNSYFEENPETEYVGCKVEIVNNSGTITGLYDKITGFPVGKYLQEENFVPTCCLSVRSELFEQEGYFGSNLISGGDKEFGKRVSSSNHGMDFLEDVVVYHPARDSLKSIRSKYFRIGRGNYQLLDTYDRRFSDEELDWRYLRWYFLDHYIIKHDEVLQILQDYESGSLLEKIGLLACSVIKRISYFSGYQYERFRQDEGLNFF